VNVPPARTGPSTTLGMTYRQALIDGERAGLSRTLVPPRKLQLLAGGTREGRRAGGSLEFRDYRDYEPGDDLRHLDWSLFARSDKLAVKRFNEEVSPFVDLIVDGSRSMALEPRKAEVTLSLAAMLATAARNGGFPYALWMARESLHRVAHGNERASQWNGVELEHPGDPAPAIVRGASMLRPFSIRVLLSDLLWPSDPAPLLHALAGGASAAIVIEVIAAADECRDLRGDLKLIDIETNEEQDIVIDDAALATFRDALIRHRQLWDDAARDSRVLLLRCVAEDVGPDLMFDALAQAEIIAC